MAVALVSAWPDARMAGSGFAEEVPSVREASASCAGQAPLELANRLPRSVVGVRTSGGAFSVSLGTFNPSC
jgi:hypothetical protein